MRLKLAFQPIEEIRLAGPSRLEGRTLFADPMEMEGLVGKSGPVRLTGTAALHPGERVRAAPVLDVVEPRAKENPETSAFPGWTGPPVTCGHGLTRVLSGMALAAVARIPGAQEGLIDMSPEAVPYCPFSRTRNLMLLFEPAEGVDRLAADHAIRMSLLRISEFLAGLARGLEPARLEAWYWPPGAADLPRAALIYLIQSQGDLRRTYVYGQPADSLLPTLLDPLEVWDGAVVSGNFVLPGNKTCTYIHQNHPVVAEMFQRHGSDMDFAGVILANEMSRLEDKERSAQFAAKLVRLLGAAAAVVNQEGGGNTVTDVMVLCRLLSNQGVKTVLLVNEFAGPDGRTPSLTETTPEATAIVSTGNNDQPITLPRVDRFVGFPPVPGIEGDPAGSVTVPLSRIYASTNQLGFNNLSCRSR
ncbi:MAG: glycine/sarcosine/betaine reductase component B subunit [Thermodesulfobacteriota bacterium]